MKAWLILLPKCNGSTLKLEEWHALSCHTETGLISLPSVERLRGSDLQQMLEKKHIEVRGNRLTGPLFKSMRAEVGVRIETDDLDDLCALLDLKVDEPGVEAC